jgi:phosphoserine phosphatase RsbU/P
MTIKNEAADAVRRLQEENFRLRRAVEELSTLNDLALAIGASVNSEEIMHTIIRRSLRAVDAEEGVITLVDESRDLSMKTLVRTMVSSSERSPFHVHQNLLGWMHINKKPLVVNDMFTDSRFHGVRWDREIRSILCVPMMVKSKLIGILTLFNKKHNETFTGEDQRLTAIIAAQSAQVIENARLYEEEQAYLRLQREIAVASKIQKELLPDENPILAGYAIAGTSISAQVVGGDYYDFIRLDEHRLCFCVGDVAGKGLSAALLMANLQATLRGQIMTSDSPGECLKKANQLLFHSTPPDRFVTLFFGLIDTRDHTLRYCNAGHDQPFYISSRNDVQRLTTGDFILGIMDTCDFHDATISFEPGDVLAVPTDGISEALNEEDEQFGEENLERSLLEKKNGTPEEILRGVVAEIDRYRGNAVQADDITMIVLKRNPSS